MTRILVAVTAIVMSLALTGRADAASSLQLRDLKVTGHHFTTTILGIDRDISVRDASKARFLVLKMSGRIPAGTAMLFAPDFVLAYSHRDGAEDRADCSAIGDLDAEGTVGRFRNGEVARLKVSGDSVQFALAFMVESDVERVGLFVVGQPDPVAYTLGSARPYSVFVTTNRDPEVLANVRQPLKDGGYDVATSAGLNRDAAGITIVHHPDTETLAREISQRLMLALKTDVKLKTFKSTGVNISEHDVLVWLGK